MTSENSPLLPDITSLDTRHKKDFKNVAGVRPLNEGQEQIVRTGGNPICKYLDRFFQISQRGSSVSTEIRAGLVTFLTMSYIILVNPPLMSMCGVEIHVAQSGTSCASAITTFLVAMFANLPVGCAPGIGLTAYYTYGLVENPTFTWEMGLTCVIISGALIFFMTFVGISKLLLDNIPYYIKISTVVGMGLLIAFIGFTNIGLVVKGEHGAITALGDLTDWKIWLSIGALFVMAGMHMKQWSSSLLVTIVVTCVIFYAVTNSWPQSFVSYPSFLLPTKTLDFYFPITKAVLGIISFILVLLFDVSGVLFGVGNLANITDENGHLPGTDAALLSVAIGTVIAGFTGCTPIIVAVESGAGIASGGRTGLTGLVVSILFALSIFLGPLLDAVPNCATSPVLIFVGVLMMQQVKEIDWGEISVAIPAFLTVVFMPFTFSIGNGIFAGIIGLIFIKIVSLAWCSCSSKSEEDNQEEDLIENYNEILP